ncbi:hypothetical protein K435DRAFT_711675 [Dendrothele bispora CBS 962.96]|uniref:Sulfhydryl oxidase n=1 Tax=Dendrothele bispora (strain CBS 962.96) TaxID=1314807 RepID=A0A4V4HID6_DENBC|nr:hypothetical protein K435DRAFT_711675 [Dendrothele bispora CBS 962.96]
MISRFAKSFVLIVVALLVLAMVGFLHPTTRIYTTDLLGETTFGSNVDSPHVKQWKNPLNEPISGVEGGVIMEKLGNATAKAALGRATWKLLHTITLRYPEHPTSDERAALNSYFHLFSRLYPCGECAHEFQQLLKEYPPQTSNRRAASLWLCHVHNEVNKRLEKPQFDCAHLDEEYDCGCGDEPIKKSDSDPMDLENDPSQDELTGAQLIHGGR